MSLGLAKQRFGTPGELSPTICGCHWLMAPAAVTISDGVIHHTDNPEAAFAEIYPRVNVRPGGQMYLAVYLKPFGHYLWIAFQSTRVHYRSPAEHATPGRNR